ncbi:MAG TPA: hypothetical protein VGP32_10690 [Steroidobacteraceae bacterium]|jgi:hypothetical protein|nr:hypothetical protein [Steroidobacteraceae bacterium]
MARIRPAAHAAVVTLAYLALASLAPAAESPATAELSVAGAALEVETRGEFGRGTEALLAWVRRSADIVARYYGRFPARSLRVRIQVEPGDGVHGGTTYANPNAFIRVRVGREVTDAQLLADWVLVHEMTHLALPDTGERHAWLSEGLATYVEGIARMQAGNRSEEDVWAEEMRAMPRGLPLEDDHGLDHTHTWGRTYWGGAMFCLLADVDIRRRTQLRFGLQDALRAILRESGGLATDWPIERVLRTGDAAVGTRTLEDLYAQMKDTAVAPDLMTLWRQLGVVSDGATVRLDDHAPLAAVRRAIMRAP